MSNWFERNATTTIIGHTILVAGLTWAAFAFIFDQNKVDAARAETQQYQAKTEVLEVELSQLREENRKYLDWMTSTPNTIPHLEHELARLSEENNSLKKNAVSATEPIPNTPNMAALVFQPLYGNTQTISIGETFVDDKTQASLGIGRIRPDFTTDAVLTLPGGKTEQVASAKPGTSWTYASDGAKYKITLLKVDWYSNKATVAVTQQSSASEP